MTRRVAMVTGASRGIGKAIALALGGRGYAVAVTARTRHEGDPTAVVPETGAALPGSLDTTVAELAGLGVEALPIRLDLLERDALVPAVEEVLDHWGRLDVLVNNAIYVGLGNQTRFLGNDPADVEKRVFGNVTAQLLLTHRALQAMVAQGSGTIVDISSGAGLHTPPRPAGEGGWSLVYAVTKGGFHRMADMLAVEYGDAGVRAFNVDPGPVATERVRAGGEQYAWIAAHGIGPEVVGEVVAWLVDDPGSGVPNGGFVQAHEAARALGLIPAAPS